MVAKKPRENKSRYRLLNLLGIMKYPNNVNGKNTNRKIGEENTMAGLYHAGNIIRFEINT